MPIESPTAENAPHSILEQKGQRIAGILSDLRQEPASSALLACFERLKNGSKKQVKHTFIEGLSFSRTCVDPRETNISTEH